VLYAPPGAACFAGMHTALKAAADAPPRPGARALVYAHRPLLGRACLGGEAPACLLVGTEEQLVLPGEGVGRPGGPQRSPARGAGRAAERSDRPGAPQLP
jgi:hypothetical protein